MSIADLIAARYCNDGALFKNASGHHLEAEACEIATYIEHDEFARRRYLFADDSAIVVVPMAPDHPLGACWDTEGPEPFSWESHDGPKERRPEDIFPERRGQKQKRGRPRPFRDAPAQD